VLHHLPSVPFSLLNLIRELRKALPVCGGAFSVHSIHSLDSLINSYCDIFLIMEKSFLKGTELTALN